MDYRALLDPRGAAKEKSKSKRPPNLGPQQKRKPPPTLQTSSAPSKRAYNPRMPSKPGAAAAGRHQPPVDSPSVDDQPQDQDSHADFTGQGSLLERMHGVINREAPPPKKRKTTTPEDEGGRTGRRTHNTFGGGGGGSGGVLGEHLKEEREKGASESGPIDLTNDDDDEVKFLSERTSADNTEVCLGKMFSTANAFHVPSVPKHQVGKAGSDMYPMTRIGLHRSPAQNNIIDLYDRPDSGPRSSAGTKFGMLEVRVAAALCPLLDGYNINKMRVKAYLPVRKRDIGEVPGQRISKLIPVVLVLYAPRRLADGLGRHFSHKQLFLSEPTAVPVDRHVEIYNPHAPRELGPVRKSVQKTQATYGVGRTAEEVLREASSMFDSLVKNEDIPEKEADNTLIITPMMSHQKKALHFLTEHERNDRESSEGAFSLWKPRMKKNRQVYYNVITNHELPEKPQPVLGGILADVMGLGKTLSVLSLIADTIDGSIEFSKQELPKNAPDVVRNTGATLILCPKSVLSNWQEQIRAHIKLGALQVYVYHGKSRTQDVDELADHDVVLTSYNTAATEFSDTRAKRSALTSLNWFRIVLDEAHQIRTQNTQVSKAACALSAQRRWAVTGTPVQNKLDDLGALIKFLRIQPFEDPRNWAQHISAPFKNADQNVLRMLRLLVDSITLRRMKDGIGLKGRTEQIVRLEFSADEFAIYSQFSKQSNMQLRIMMKDGGRLKGKSYAHVLKSLSRLRAICAHGREMLGEDDRKELEGLTESTAIELGDEPTEEPDDTFITDKVAYETLHMMSESEADYCACCGSKVGDKKTDPDVVANADPCEEDDSSAESSEDEENDLMGYLTPCYHLFCTGCRDTYIQETRPTLTVDGHCRCKYCEQYVRFGLFEFKKSGLRDMLNARERSLKKGASKWDESTYSGPHTKVKALLDELRQSADESKRLNQAGEPPIRSVVFSGWTTYLDLMEHAFDEHGIGHVRLDGSMSIKARSTALSTFASDPDVSVLLVSIKAGGQGLNLTAANKVYMMEPQFNPGVEHQAIDRVHRLGQKRDVEIKHFIMRNSVEEKILVLQDKKVKLAQLSMEKKMGRDEEAKRRMEELKELFK